MLRLLPPHRAIYGNLFCEVKRTSHRALKGNLFREVKRAVYVSPFF